MKVTTETLLLCLFFTPVRLYYLLWLNALFRPVVRVLVISRPYVLCRTACVWQCDIWRASFGLVFTCLVSLCTVSAPLPRHPTRISTHCQCWQILDNILCCAVQVAVCSISLWVMSFVHITVSLLKWIVKRLIHWHTHPFKRPFSRTTQVSRYQKGKTNVDFTEARDSEWQWHQLGYIQVCTLLQTTTPAPHHSVFLQAGCPSCRPTDSIKALKAKALKVWLIDTRVTLNTFREL